LTDSSISSNRIIQIPQTHLPELAELKLAALAMRVECVNSPFVLLFILLVSTTAILGQTQMTPTSSVARDQEPNNHKGEDGGDGKNIVKYVLAAKYLHDHSPGGEGSSMLVIPSRPVRRLGSEFLGKRSDMPIHGGKARITKRRAMGSEFLGKRRAMGSEFLGKRGGIGSPVEDYALSSMETSGWTRPEDGGYPLEGLEMMQKKNNVAADFQRTSDYIGNARKFHEYPAWKQSLNSRLLQFDKKRRAMGSEFLGKRSSPLADE
jgi:hypothetical protein